MLDKHYGGIMDAINIRTCALADLNLLREISIITSNETFRAQNDSDVMDQYLKTAYSEGRLRSELQNPNSQFYFVYVGEVLAGYLKLNQLDAQTEFQEENALEVERIYILTSFKGRGIGKRLIQFSEQQAKALGKEILWLGVWEKNYNALAFYKKMDFVIFGSHAFQMAHELQTDYVMKKQI